MRARRVRLFLAEWDSGSFAWRGVGETREEAIDMVLQAWLVHCRRSAAVVDASLFEEGDVNVVELETGTGWRDNAVLYRADREGR